MNGNTKQKQEYRGIKCIDEEFILNFLQDINNKEPLYVYIKGHLYLESLMIVILERNFSYKIKIDMFSFKQKLELISGLGIIDSQDKAVISKVNNIRNSIAHNVEIKIDDVVVEDIISTLPKKTKDKIKANVEESEFTIMQCFFIELFAYLLFRLDFPFREYA
ncbi:hypothetical protein [Bacillus cereus]|uniref:hypothetical protein n=1 Tax=Bacillus cereus TaxID=1396 RepID=UPI00111F9DC5|nr:hypothetical protein [Bacillus cereus]MDA1966208.1 hypothetical protein [Bacillus cereus]TNO64912.1 hypothetical protein FHR06_18620 [Bacillus cereus]UDV84566.1 hypothetical protein HQJ03_011605 [Bacillus cereus]UDV90112.1 hypothetical protein HQG80_011590 [Bacillus cereus]